MSISSLLVLLRFQWKLAIAIFLSVAASIVGITFLVTPTFTASATVVLDVKSPDPIAGIVLPGMTVSSYMGTQVDVVRSERVAIAAIDRLGLATSEPLLADWRRSTGGRGEFRSWLADSLLKNLEVRPAKDSNALTIAFTSPDPEYSAKVANAFVRAYIDTTVELRTEPAREYNQLFEGRARQMRSDLERAQARLSEFQQKSGIVASDERLDIANARLIELSSQLVSLQAVAGESGSRQQQEATGTDGISEVLESRLIADLTAALSRDEGRLAELSSRLGDEHPQVKELRQAITQARSRLAAETRKVRNSVGINNAINQGRVAQTRAALEEQRDIVLRMKVQRDEMSTLVKEVESAQRAYDEVLARLNQTTLESQTSQTNVSILKTATAPPFASSPKRELAAIAAILLGLVASLGAVVGFEQVNPKLRSEMDAFSVLGQPVIGTLPHWNRGAHYSSGARAKLRLVNRPKGLASQ